MCVYIYIYIYICMGLSKARSAYSPRIEFRAGVRVAGKGTPDPKITYNY